MNELCLPRYALSACVAAILVASCDGNNNAVPQSNVGLQSERLGRQTELPPSAPRFRDPERVLYAFCAQPSCSDGETPNAVTVGPDGALYGTSQSYGNGLVFEVRHTASGYAERVLYSFRGQPDGANPVGDVRFDAKGALYGATYSGGSAGGGTVFKLTPSGSSYVETVLYSFLGSSDGANPTAGVILDKRGAIYGTTSEGGLCTAQCGTVFKLMPAGSTYKKKTIYSFKGQSDGLLPSGNIVRDRSGAIYGTTVLGGLTCHGYSGGCGTVYKLIPKHLRYSESVLYRFQGWPDAGNPSAGLTLGNAGALYGTSPESGASTEGAVFKLVPSGSGYAESVLYSFNEYCLDKIGAFPSGGVIVDAKGVVYGTTSFGCTYDSYFSGSVFALTPSGSNYNAQLLYSFCERGSHYLCADGAVPNDVIFGPKGTLYGTTAYGGIGPCAVYRGPKGCGTVFKLKMR